MQKRNTYIEKSLKLFLRFGVKSVTIGDIANHLNISTKTIYKIFGDKTGLVNECLLLDNEIIEQAYHRILSKNNVLEAMIEFYNEFIHRISSVNPNYFIDIQKYFPEIWKETTSHGIQQIKELLKRGVEAGYFYHKIDIDITAQTIALLIKAMLDDEILPLPNQDRRKLATHIIYPYLKGICTSKGLGEIRDYMQRTKMVN